MESSTAIAIASGLNIMVLIIIDRSSPMSPYMHDNNIMQSTIVAITIFGYSMYDS